MMDLETLLNACLSNDNQVRKQAEEALRSVSSKPAVVPELVSKLQQSHDAQVRQLAAILLRKRIARHWNQLPREAQQHIKVSLLERIAHEPVHAVRRSVSDVAGVVAKHAVPKNEWNDILLFIQQCSASSSAEHREVALTLLTSLSETIGEHLQPSLSGLQQIILQGLRDPSEPVRVAALKSMLPLIFLVANQQDIATFHTLVAAMLQTTRDAVQAGSEDICTLACQVLIELLENPAPLAQPQLPAIVELCMELAANVQLDLATREQALQVVHWVARWKPKQLTKNKALIKHVVAMLCQLCCEPRPEDHDDAQQLPACMMASQALDTVALHCSAQHIYPQVLAFAGPACASPDPNVRAAAMTTLGVISQGCAEPLRRRLGELLPPVLHALQDGDKNVRAAAALALGLLSEFLQPDIIEQYQTVLPSLFTIMHDPTPDVLERACYALDSFCENLEQEILPYVPQLVDRLLDVLRIGNHDVQEMALSALSSTASAAGKHFQPYVDRVLPVLQHFMSTTSSELLNCRCRATECAGLVIEALSQQPAAAAVAQHLMQLGLQGVQGSTDLQYNTLREFTHGMFSCIAKALGPDFAQYLQYVVPLALQSCNLDDGTFGDSGSDSDDDESGSVALDDISDSDDANARAKAFSVRTGVLDEKCSATQALGIYAQSSPTAFVPYLEQALNTVLEMSKYFHEEVRCQASEALALLCTSAHAAFPPPAGAVQSVEAHKVLSLSLPALLLALEDDDKGAVAYAFNAFTKLMKELGAQAIGPQTLEQVSTAAATTLSGNAACQQEDDADEGEELEDDENGELDEELLSAVAEALPALAAAVGADAFAPVFASQHLAPLLVRLKPNQPEGVRGIMVGALAEVAEHLKHHMTPHIDKLFPPLLRELRCEDAVNRQNAAFCLGMLVQGCGATALAPYMGSLLQALHPLFGPKESAGTRDNAVGAVARMMLVAPAVLPLEQVVPIYLKALPLKEDLSEAAVVYQALGALVTGDQAARVAACVPGIIQAFGAAAVQAGLPNEVRKALGCMVAALRSHHAEHVDPLLGQLPEDQRQALAQLVHLASLQL